MEETNAGKRAVKEVILPSKGVCDRRVPEHCLFSMCWIPCVYKKGKCVWSGTSQTAYVCLSARFERPIMCSVGVLSDSAKISKIL